METGVQGWEADYLTQSTQFAVWKETNPHPFAQPGGGKAEERIPLFISTSNSPFFLGHFLSAPSNCERRTAAPLTSPSEASSYRPLLWIKAAPLLNLLSILPKHSTLFPMLSSSRYLFYVVTVQIQ